MRFINKYPESRIKWSTLEPEVFYFILFILSPLNGFASLKVAYKKAGGYIIVVLNPRFQVSWVCSIKKWNINKNWFIYNVKLLNFWPS